MKLQKINTPLLILVSLVITAFAAQGQMTVYNNFGEDQNGWNYNWGLGWTIAGINVPQQYGVEQAMEFQSSADGKVSDIWVAISSVPLSSPPDTVIIRLTENPYGLPPDTADIIEEWTLTNFESWSQWNTPIHLEGSGISQLQEEQSYWLWAIAKETTWTMWCMNENPSFTCPHAMRREDEDWLTISNETAAAFRVDVAVGTDISNLSYGISNEHSLSQNYPNPFNTTTKISYSIAKPCFVHLKVFDMFGREIRTLVSESQDTGEYNIDFDAAQFPSGFYFYHLQAGSQIVDIKKMSYMK